MDEGKPVKKGFGGWLVLFQIRMYIYLVVYYLGFATENAPLPLLVMFLLTAVCMVFFYSRSLAFRPLYFILAWVMNAVLAAVTVMVPSQLSVMLSVTLVSVAVDAVITVALMRSERVRDTFVRNRRKNNY